MTEPDEPDQSPWRPSTVVHGGQGVLAGNGNTQTNVYHQHTTYPARTVTWPVRVGTPPPVDHHYQPRYADTAVAAALAVGDAAVLVGAPTGTGTVVRGQGGVGKSQTAARLAWSLWKDPGLDVAVWVSALSHDAVLTAYTETAKQVLCERHPDIDTRPPQDAARLLRDWLAATDRQWLIVFDDLQDPGDLRDLWPRHHRGGRVVVTTRHRDSALGQGRVVVELDVFTETEAEDYLRGVLPDTDPEDLRGLTRDLGGLPLALAQAAAFINDNPLLTVAGYRERLADRRRTLAELMPATGELPDHHRDTVAATWSLSIEHADTLRPKGLARPVLRLLSLLDPNGTPLTVLTTTAIREHLATVVSRTVTSDDVADALGVLHQLSLATIGSDRSIRMHALLQRAVRDALTDDTTAELALIAATALVEAWPEIDTRDVALAQALRSATTTLHDTTTPALLTPDAHVVLFRAGHSLGDSGQVHAVVTHFARLYEDTTRHLGPDHPATLTTRRHLARWRGEAGDWAGAATEFRTLLDDYRRLLGPDHPATLATRSHLASWRGKAGDWAGAATEFRTLLDDYRRVLGPDHPDTLYTRSHLARWRGQAGDPAGAATEFRTLLDDFRRVLGPGHPDTLTTRNGLASWRGEAGDPAGAATEFRTLLDDRLRVLGPDHPDTLATRIHLARWRGGAGDPAGAATECQELLEDQLRVLGPDHPETLTTRSHLAHWRGEAGDPVGAATELRTLLDDYRRVLGPNHPDTLYTRRHLAHWRGEAGDPVGAATELRTLLDDFHRVLGPGHPYN
ncbi:tetratricopeptide repeat protein [Saccharothrix saharensis]|uniref:Tetratricopeptide repeat protein n=1 Tax=Saccharothrix saharensis TaxID=571190 RepID=A0A543J5P8_9PSEU|nr:FxSxx-COOH system tetratricopeptide repeat protein [Saccharothrix saharensis]TQM78156.1 tetratricopeptide repeat protein [Saccharothrix saharensis]